MDLRNDPIGPALPAGIIPPEDPASAGAAGAGDGADAAAFEAALARAVEGLTGRQGLAASRLPAEVSADATGGTTGNAEPGEGLVDGAAPNGVPADATTPGVVSGPVGMLPAFASGEGLALARAALPGLGTVAAAAGVAGVAGAAAEAVQPAPATGTAMPVVRLTADGLPLREVALGEGMRLITPAAPDPDTASLVRFARANGFDEAAVRQLFGSDAIPPDDLPARTAPAAWVLPAAARAPAPAGPAAGVVAATTMLAPSAATTAAIAATAATTTAATVTAAAPAVSAAWALAARGQTQAQAGAADPGGASGLADASPDPVSGGERLALAVDAAGATRPEAAPIRPAAIALANPGVTVPDPIGEAGGAAPIADLAADPAALPDAAADAPPVYGIRLPELQRAGMLQAASAQAAAGPGAEAFEEAARRLADAVSQRVVAEVRRGHWEVAFALDPPELGRVEVSLQMRAGELEARFTAQHGLARELLQEALPRLREGLQQSGMDVAQLQVGLGLQTRSGGNPTPGDRPGASGGTGAGSSGQAEAVAPVGAREPGHEGGTVDVWA
jgi:flagellar hook-length control protein FliK